MRELQIWQGFDQPVQSHARTVIKYLDQRVAVAPVEPDIDFTGASRERIVDEIGERGFWRIAQAPQ